MEQTNETVKYISRGKNHTLFHTPKEAVLSLSRVKKEKDFTAIVRPEWIPSQDLIHLSFQLVGSDAGSKMEGINESPGRSTYLIGNDPSGWQKNIPHYGMVKYHSVYAGIDLVLATDLGDIMIKVPETYQEVDGNKELIASDSEINERGQITFQIDLYDESIPAIFNRIKNNDAV